jgi:hypothetical protein
MLNKFKFFYSQQKYLYQAAFGIFMCLIATSALAIKMDSLYKGTVPVTTQAVAERNQAIQQALTQVLIKVSGNTQILNNPKLKSRLKTADTLIQQFSYITPPPNKNNVAPYLIEVQFDPVGVNEWLRDAGVAIWGQNRPLILAWIVYEAPGHPAEIMSNDPTIEAVTLLKQYAGEHGLPIMLPMMDITDLDQVSVKDITDMAIPQIVNASKRYAGDAILIGHITQNDGNFISQWKFIMDNNQWNWNITDKNTNSIATLINNITNTLAARFAVVTTNTIQKDLTLKVMGITQYSDFAQLTRYLNHLTPVASVEITNILTNNNVILKISLRSTQESFIKALSLGKKLTPVSNTNTTDTMVVYQWNP